MTNAEKRRRWIARHGLAWVRAYQRRKVADLRYRRRGRGLCWNCGWPRGASRSTIRCQGCHIRHCTRTCEYMRRRA